MPQLFSLGKPNKNLRAVSVLAIFCLCFAISACSNKANQYTAETPNGKATMGAISQTKYLLNARTGSANIEYSAPTTQTIKAPLDVLILFDRTASMQDVISTTANAAEKIVADVQKIAPDTRFAVAAVSDYSPLFTDDADNRTWLLLTDFTYKADAVQAASKDIKLVNGGDTPEAYVRGLYEASELAWRDKAIKVIIFFGDATAHSPDPGRDETFDTADDLQMDDVLKTLKTKNIAVIGIHAKNDDEVLAEFNRVSESTRGKTVSLDNASESASMIKNAITDALPDAPNLQANGDFASWISTTNTGKSKPNLVEYAINISVPDSAPAGVYAIPLTLVATSGEADPMMQAFADKSFEIKLITGWYNHPLVLWLPLLALLLCLLYSAIKLLKGGYSQSRHVTSKRSYDADSYSLMHLLLDILALASLVCTSLAVYLAATGQVLSQIL
jgi:PBP1b-binding outer membrane lipoprotein LpoB